ncbi:MAG: hypothetical protein GY903_25295 [Fuerstiella sp.]|nr:hypothetical protein [Fuerstiella sp.]MCP4783102.1 hypothetical protein [Fuerstiella sp.]MCP4857813.1 hypothetical protein [Fuerstiella sp.]
MSSKQGDVPRREFLKYSSLLSAGAAAAVYLNTDAKVKAAPPVGKFGGQGANQYIYAEP